MIARAIRDTQRGIECVEQDSELDTIMTEEVLDSVSQALHAQVANGETEGTSDVKDETLPEQQAKLEPEVEEEPAGGSSAGKAKTKESTGPAALVSQIDRTTTSARAKASTSVRIPTAAKAAAVVSTLSDIAKAMPQSRRNYEIQVDIKEN